MARALRAWAINRGGKNSVRNLRYGPRTRLVRGIYYTLKSFEIYYLAEDANNYQKSQDISLPMFNYIFIAKRHVFFIFFLFICHTQ